MFFSPEFRNRLDAVVEFNHINEDMGVQIAAKAIRMFEDKLAGKKIKLEVTDRCYSWLSQKGFSSAFGAREIMRLVNEKIKNYFVEEVLFGKLSGGGTAVVDIKDDDIFIDAKKN